MKNRIVSALAIVFLALQLGFSPAPQANRGERDQGTGLVYVNCPPCKSTTCSAGWGERIFPDGRSWKMRCHEQDGIEPGHCGPTYAEQYEIRSALLNIFLRACESVDCSRGYPLNNRPCKFSGTATAPRGPRKGLYGPPMAAPADSCGCGENR